jgi:4-amino-4-deoxy-L-arabinose transferase-like glycosyltransferase
MYMAKIFRNIPGRLLILIFAAVVFVGIFFLSIDYMEGLFRIDMYCFPWPDPITCILAILFFMAAYLYYTWDKYNFNFPESRSGDEAAKAKSPLIGRAGYIPVKIFLFIIIVLLGWLTFPNFVMTIIKWHPLKGILFIVLANLFLYIFFFGFSRLERSPLYIAAEYVLKGMPSCLFDVCLILIGLFVLYYIEKWVFSSIWFMSDSTSQLAQARLMFSGKWFIESPPPLKDWVAFVNGTQGNRIYSQYPPGYIILLYWLMSFGVEQYAGVIIGALTLPAIHRLGRLTVNETTGRMAAIIILLSPYWAIMSTQGMNHSLVLLLLLLFIICFIKIWENRQKSNIYALVCGFLIAWIGITRPLNGIVYFLAACVAILVWRRSFKRGCPLLLWFLGGMLLWALYFLYYNYQTGGSLWSIGYRAAYPQMNRMGFDFMGVPDYPVSLAVKRLIANMLALNDWFFFWPAFGWFPFILWWLKGRKNHKEMFLLIVIILQIMAYFCYHFHDLFIGPRFWYELIGPLVVLFSAGLMPLLGCFEGAEKRTESRLIIGLVTILVLGYFSIHGFVAGLNKKADKFIPMIFRGALVKKSLAKMEFPERSILLFDLGYTDWMWLYGMDYNKKIYCTQYDINKIGLLRERYPDYHFYTLDQINAVWVEIH